jgi:tetrahydromethanopterin S-methyltransferase subunit F
MRVKSIKISLEIPVPLNELDKNGVVYTEEAISKSCENTKNLPIIVYDRNNQAKVVGVAEFIKYKNGIILADGRLFFGGTEEEVFFDDSSRIISMEIGSFGIG